MPTHDTTSIDMLDPQLIADPYGGYGALREQAPIVRGKGFDGAPVWFVTRQEDVRAVLTDPRLATSPTAVPGDAEDRRAKLMEQIGVPAELVGYLTQTILDADGVDHTRLRKLVSRTFTVRRVNELRPRVEAIVRDLLDGLTDPAELLEEYSYPLPITVICELVGVPEPDRPAWRRWGKALVTMNPATVGQAMPEMIAYCHDLAARRRAAPENDLLSGLVAAGDDDEVLTETEIVTMLLTLVFAGHETTAHLISNGIVALLTHPDQLALLRADPGLWPAAVGELMRFCSPVQIARMRFATTDVELGGVVLAAGDVVQPVLVSANRDPRVYPDPDRLDVTRRPAGRGDGHVGFGHGAHYCLGAALARQEGEVALRALFDRYPDLRLAAEPEWVQLPGARRLTGLPVHLH